MTTAVSTARTTDVNSTDVPSNQVDGTDLLEQSWRTPTGIMRFLTAVNHRMVGARYRSSGTI